MSRKRYRRKGKANSATPRTSPEAAQSEMAARQIDKTRKHVERYQSGLQSLMKVVQYNRKLLDGALDGDFIWVFFAGESVAEKMNLPNGLTTPLLRAELTKQGDGIVAHYGKR